MAFPPEAEYVETAGGRLAFQRWGDGEPRFVAVHDVPTHLDLLWTERSYVDQLRRAGRMAQVLTYDRRGMGTSDPLDAVPTLEREVADLEAIMDAAGFDRATVFGYAWSTPIATLFAASRPHRVDRLVLLGPLARGWKSVGPWPAPITGEMMAAIGDGFEDAVEHWGEGRTLALVAPDFDTPRNRRLFAMLERSSCSRAVARELLRVASQVDVTDVLPSVRAPTLVLIPRSVADPAVHQYVADLIPGAQVRQVQSPPHPMGMGDYWEPVFDEIELFITGHRAVDAPTRTYATLLFTDIVSSTEHAARLGDHAWRLILLRHDELLLDEVEAAGGAVIHPTGDGALSMFDGPEQAVRCATRMVERVHELGIQIRAGAHTGACEWVGRDLAGIAVHVAARVVGKAGADEILITDPPRRLLAGSGFAFTPTGDHQLKGVPGDWALYAVTTSAPPALEAKDTALDLRTSDRAVLLAARRAPRLLQALGKLSERRLRRR